MNNSAKQRARIEAGMPIPRVNDLRYTVGMTAHDSMAQTKEIVDARMVLY